MEEVGVAPSKLSKTEGWVVGFGDVLREQGLEIKSLTSAETMPTSVRDTPLFPADSTPPLAARVHGKRPKTSSARATDCKRVMQLTDGTMFFLDMTLESKIAYEGKTTDAQVGCGPSLVSDVGRVRAPCTKTNSARDGGTADDHRVPEQGSQLQWHVCGAVAVPRHVVSPCEGLASNTA